jgi:hypothetical protein
MVARLVFVLVAVLITIGAYHFLPALIFGGSDPAPKPAASAAKPSEPVTYVDINMKEREQDAAPAP